MAKALGLARRGLYTTHPNPRVGCLLCRGDQIIATGWHQYAGGDHAEIHALKAAGTRTRDATLYVTLEPCHHQGRTGPCSEAIIAAGVGRVVVAMTDPNPLVAGTGMAALREAGIAVDCGLLEDSARQLNPGFVSRMQRGRPWVRLKLAMSLDGRTAMAGGESQWISGQAARADVQHWRARSDAVITGIGTVLGDDPSLNVRPENLARHRHYPEGEVRQPLRVILDSRARTPAAAGIFKNPGETLIIIAADAVPERPLPGTRAHVDHDADGLDLQQVLARLHDRQINEAFIESGPRLAGAFLAAALVDEVILYQAPVCLGHEARPLLQLPGLQRLADKLEFEFTEVRRIGADLRLRLTRKST